MLSFLNEIRNLRFTGLKHLPKVKPPVTGTTERMSFLHPQGASSSLILKLSILSSPKVATPQAFPVRGLAAKSTSTQKWTSGTSHLLFQSVTSSPDPISILPVVPPNSPPVPTWTTANTSHLVSLLSSCSLLHAAPGID